jgi:hypothetical protein
MAAESAITFCGLADTLKRSTLYYRVQMARAKGTYDSVLKKKAEQILKNLETKVGLVINVDDDDASQTSSGASRNVSPVTTTTLTSLSSSDACTITTRSSSTGEKRYRRTSRQASVERLEDKRFRIDYEGRFKAAFKKATSLVADKTIPYEPTKSTCNRLNVEYNLDGKRVLRKSSVQDAARAGVVGGVSPKKMGPIPKIPDDFLLAVATHAEVCQVGDGELKGRDVKRLIGASIIGTRHEGAIKVDSVWRKIRKEHPASFQAASKMSVDDSRAQWTTYTNLDQWFDDAKKDLLSTGLVVDEKMFNDEGGLVSELHFKKDTERRIINLGRDAP